jgi:hypothetical protein
MSGIFIACLIILITFSDQHVLRIGNAEVNNESRPKFQDFNFVAAGDFGCGNETLRNQN